MNKENIFQILLDYCPFWTKLDYWINRKFYTDNIIEQLGSKLVKVLVWFRRSGKSYILRYIINYLIEKKAINKNNILYLNFEDDRLFNFRNVENLRFIYETYLEKINPSWKIYILFDEIQVINWWESFIRTLYERGDNIEIFLTWSNSNLLSYEINSLLSWRFIEFNIYPLDFKEFLLFNWIEIASEKSYLKNKIEINRYFNEFIKYWALPEILEFPTEKQKIWYLKSVFNKIILDDIVSRFKIRNVELIKIVNKYLLTNIWWVLSAKRVINWIKSYWFQINNVTLIEYIDYIKKWFLIYDISRFDWKINRVFESSKKYYCLDLWIREVEKINFDNDLSKKLENLVFIKLIKDQVEVYYWQDDNQKEIDFLIKKWNKFTNIQVCKKLDEQNMEIELWSFVLSNKYQECKKIVISLENSNEELIYKWNQISVINIIYYLLGI